MSRIIAVTLLLALGACFYSAAPVPYYTQSSGDYSNNGGGPGPGERPTNPGASGGGGN